MSRKKILTIFMIGCLIAFSIHISSLCYKYYSYAKDNTYVYKEHKQIDDAIKVVMIGDSWAAYHHAAGHDSLLALMIGKYSCRHITVNASGMVGAKTKRIYELMFDSISPAGTRSLLHQKPDYCIISAGINDAVAKIGAENYCYHYMLILKQLLANHIKPIVIDMPDVGYQSVYQRESYFSQFRHWLSCKLNDTDMWSFDDYRNSLAQSIKKSSYTQKIIYIDAKEWNPLGFQDPQNLYLEDNIHLNFKGYTLLDSCIAKHICMDKQ